MGCETTKQIVRDRVVTTRNPAGSGYRLDQIWYSNMSEFMAIAEACSDGEYDKHKAGREWTWGKDFPNYDLQKPAIQSGSLPVDKMQDFIDFRDRISAQLDNLDLMHDLSPKRKRRYSEDDGDLDVDRYLDGEDNIWVTRDRNKVAKIIKLGIQFNQQCSIDAQQVIETAMIGCAIADALQINGFGVEVTAVDARLERPQRLAHCIPVKQAHEPIDVNRIGAIYSGLLRYWGFNINRPVFGWDIGQGGNPDLAGWELEALGLDLTIKHDVKDKLDKVITGLKDRITFN